MHQPHHIKSGIRCFWGEVSSSSFIRLQPKMIFEKPGNDLNDEVNADTSGIESSLSSKSQKVKTKRDRWSDQQN